MIAPSNGSFKKLASQCTVNPLKRAQENRVDGEIKRLFYESILINKPGKAFLGNPRHIQD